jgi:hypothetical protein
MKISNNFLRAGEKYLGELLIADYGVEGIKEDSYYVILNNGEIVEIV